MKIIYHQPDLERQSGLSRFGVYACYFKKLILDRDKNRITKKVHHHTGFEVHIVTDGYQEYEVRNKTYKLEAGSFLLIYPNVPHKVISSALHTQKYSLTFNLQINESADSFFGKITTRMLDNIDLIVNEEILKKESSSVLIENCILEIIISVFRLSGMKEKTRTYSYEENTVLNLAKQYIDDNIEMAPSVADVSEYCYLSAKQLTRLFNRFEGISPGEYIISRRIKETEKLLADHTLSLKQISEIMNFNNEYYFNAFFKKHSGMPPGEYRKMLGK